MKLIILVTTLLLAGFAFGGDCDEVTPCNNCTCEDLDETVADDCTCEGSAEGCTGNCSTCDSDVCDEECTCECDVAEEVEEFHCGGGGCGGSGQ